MTEGQVETREGKRCFTSAIMPCYNEEMWVAETLEALLRCPTVDEVMVIDDGSTDRTPEILQHFQGRANIVRLGKNEGKGFAMAVGIERARGGIVVFLDAHLLNLNDDHIRGLIRPLIEGEADATLGISLPKAVSPLWPWTGQRAYFKESLLPHLEEIRKSRFGVETYLNDAFKDKQVKLVRLKGLIHLPKYQKMSLSQVFDSYLTEAVEIAETLGRLRGIEVKDLLEAVSPEKIRSIKALTERVNSQKVKEVVTYIKEYIVPYLEGRF